MEEDWFICLRFPLREGKPETGIFPRLIPAAGSWPRGEAEFRRPLVRADGGWLASGAVAGGAMRGGVGWSFRDEIRSGQQKTGARGFSRERRPAFTTQDLPRAGTRAQCFPQDWVPAQERAPSAGRRAFLPDLYFVPVFSPGTPSRPPPLCRASGETHRRASVCSRPRAILYAGSEGFHRPGRKAVPIPSSRRAATPQTWVASGT